MLINREIPQDFFKKIPPIEEIISYLSTLNWENTSKDTAHLVLRRSQNLALPWHNSNRLLILIKGIKNSGMFVFAETDMKHLIFIILLISR